MTRRLTALFAALEALLVVAVGIVVPLVPLTLVWAAHFGFSPDWTVFWRAAVDIWLLGHGVDVTFTLDPELAAGLGMPSAGDPVTVTIALLGFALGTALLGVRAGGRIADTGHALVGGITAVVAFAAASVGVTATALHVAARPSLWQALVLPAVAFGVGLGAGMLRAGRTRTPGATGSSPRAGALKNWLDDRPVEVVAGVGAALRGGIAAVALTIAAASVLVALLFVLRFAEMIGLYEALHTEVVGGVALTAGQLSVLPNLVLWAASWLVGPGFAIGVGSHVSPLGTALGPLPALPVLGALPPGDGSSSGAAFGFLGLLVPVVAAFLAGVAIRPALTRAVGYLSPLLVIAVAAGTGVVGGTVLGLLAAASAGAAGPGRLAVVGPDGLLVGLLAAAEFAIAAGIGLAAASRLPTPRR